MNFRFTFGLFLIFGSFLSPVWGQDLSLSELKEEIKNQQGRVESRIQELKKGKEELAALEEKFAEKKEEADRYSAVKISLDEARLKAKSLEDELRRKEGLLTYLEENFKPKINLVEGTSFESLTLKSGRKLTAVKISDISGTNVRVQHSDGFAMVPVEDLPDELSSKAVLKPIIESVPPNAAVLFALRPKGLINLPIFAETKKAELAAARATSRSDSAPGRFDQIRQERQQKLEAERAERTQTIDKARQESMANNQKLDEEIARAEKLITENEAAIRAERSQFETTIATEKIQSQADEERREKLISQHNNRMETLNNNVVGLRLRTVELQNQKRSIR